MAEIRRVYAELPMLTVKRANVSDDGWKHLTTLKALSVLSLMYVPISDRAVEALRQLQGVDKFRIYGGRLTAAGVERLRQDLPNSEIDYRRGAFLAWAVSPDRNAASSLRSAPTARRKKPDC